MKQLPLHLPPVPADDILREKIKDIERQLIAAESYGYDELCQSLQRERARLKGILKKP